MLRGSYVFNRKMKCNVRSARTLKCRFNNKGADVPARYVKHCKIFLPNRTMITTSSVRAYEELLKVLDTYREHLDHCICDNNVRSSSTLSSETLEQSKTSFEENMCFMSSLEGYLPLTNCSRPISWMNHSLASYSNLSVANIEVCHLRRIPVSNSKYSAPLPNLNEFHISKSSNPVLRESLSPVLSESLSPVLSESLSPVLSESSSPVLSESSSPVLSESSSAVLSESLSAVLSESSSPVLSESSSPVLSESSSPVLSESSSPVLSESSSPVLSESSSAVSKESNVLENYVASYDPTSLNENLYNVTENSEREGEVTATEDVIQEKVYPVVEEINPTNASTKEKQKKKKDPVVDNKALKQNERNKYFVRSLKSYIEVCGSADMVYRAHDTFLYYRQRNLRSTKKIPLYLDVGVYNALLNCWAEEGNLQRMKEVSLYMAEDSVAPDLQSHVLRLKCLSRSQKLGVYDLLSEVQNICEHLKTQKCDIHAIFKQFEFPPVVEKRIENVLRKSNVNIDLETSKHLHHTVYSCKLLEELNAKEHGQNGSLSCIDNSISKDDIHLLTGKQMQLEIDYFVNVKSVKGSSSVTEETLKARKVVEECLEMFRKDLSSGLDAKLANLYDDVRMQKCMTLYPYVHVVDKKFLVEMCLQEARFLAESAEYFSPGLKVLCRNLGEKIMNHYFIWLKKRNKVTDKISFLYSKYLEYLITPELASMYTPRDYWQFLKCHHCKGPAIDVPDVPWPPHVLYEVGNFLYELLLENTSFDTSKLNAKPKKKVVIRPFHMIYEKMKKPSSGKDACKTSLQIRADPTLSKMFREAQLEDLPFDVSMVPMVCPPRPWVRLNTGGLLMTSTPFIRFPSYAQHHFAYYADIPNEQFYPCFDSLNSLSLCPWIINKPVLDLIIEVFKDGGSEELDVAINPATLPASPKMKQSMTPEEKKVVRRQKHLLKKESLECTSLWYDCLYKLSIANHFRDTIFWFPHNIDFRGRVYPTPPHFNHLGSDLVRSILLFAEGKPLGKNGLDWLKIHLINLTGLKKREPNSERLRYANEIMPEIFDSADKPFTGNQWWKTSDEPWQTLACCKELASAVRSPNPSEYVSHFPIHQDGSCNGLQHYAALGRDELGAEGVNLLPADRPQDVYSAVVALVEEERKKNVAEGVEIAKVLEGFVKRKVVKQTVMTVVYGVTEYGAKLQILRQLLDIPEFPEKEAQHAAQYLMKLTFLSIQKMFKATKEIQKWFIDCAELITRSSEKPVEWVTPLGLPVLQPYHRKTVVATPSSYTTKENGVFCSQHSGPSRYVSTYESYELPDVRKQKNAFAPNFIHSLDSSHMMLTSLFCQRHGITFVSVHDCFWTHPCAVEIMNRVCREQFIALHNEPILENFSKFCLQKYLGENISGGLKKDKQHEKLRAVLSDVPEKGSFDLKNVLDSVYFFS